MQTSTHRYERKGRVRTRLEVFHHPPRDDKTYDTPSFRARNQLVLRKHDLEQPLRHVVSMEDALALLK
jgi:hypothetical protein